MNQEKFGQLIKEIRKKNNLTQKQLADKYHVTYQAVSKWENGKNMPDTALIKQISEDFNISLEELYNGEFNHIKKKKYKLILFIIPIFVIFIFIIIILKTFSKEEFKFKTLSTNCENFNISGNISYSSTKSAIYITNIKYCGGDNLDSYKTIECTLYESHDDIERKISSYKYNNNKNIKLEEFLEQVTFVVDDYESSCKDYKHSNLYLSINATDNSNKVITFKIPLKLENCLK